MQAVAEEVFAPPAPQSIAEMARYYERIVALERKVEDNRRYKDERIAQIAASCDGEEAALLEQITMWRDSIIAFLSQLGEERVRLPDLGVSMAAKPEKGLRWTDEGALKAWAVKNDFLHEPKPPDPGPDKNRIKEHWQTTGEVPDGAEIKTGTTLSVSKIGTKLGR